MSPLGSQPRPGEVVRQTVALRRLGGAAARHRTAAKDHDRSVLGAFTILRDDATKRAAQGRPRQIPSQTSRTNDLDEMILLKGIKATLDR